jgi:hypothetical protein
MVRGWQSIEEADDRESGRRRRRHDDVLVDAGPRVEDHLAGYSQVHNVGGLDELDGVELATSEPLDDLDGKLTLQAVVANSFEYGTVVSLSAGLGDEVPDLSFGSSSGGRGASKPQFDVDGSGGSGQLAGEVFVPVDHLDTVLGPPRANIFQVYEQIAHLGVAMAELLVILPCPP